MKKKTAKKSPLDQIKTRPSKTEIPVILNDLERSGNLKNMRLNPVLEKHLGYCLYRVAVKFRAIVDQALADENLIAPQFGMLNILKSTNGINQMTLGQQMGLDKATVVKLLDGLEAAGHVVRVASDTDRREKLLKVTNKGLKYIDRVIPRIKAVETEFLQPLSDAERLVFVKAVSKLMQPK
jgi:DNA-binding MarR family transcriptional regulator